MIKTVFGWLLFTMLLLSPLLAMAEGEHITLQLKWKHAFQFAGYYMALEKGYYRNAGLDVTVLEGGPGKSSVDHVITETAAYGITSTGALLARSHGMPVKALGAIFQHSPLALLVLKQSGIKRISDLRGKRVMLQTGFQNAGILAALQQAGIGEHDFIRQNISYNIEDLIEGKTDAFSAYTTDQPYQLDLLHVPYRIFRPNDQGIDFYGDIVITSDAEVRNHPQRVQAFMKATERGWNDALEHIDEAIDLILLKYNTQHFSRRKLRFEAEQSARLILQDVVNIGYMNNFRWQRIARVYAEQGLLPADYPVADFIYQPEPGLSDFIKAHQWQLLLAVLLFVLLVFAINIAILRKTVRSRTEKLSESENNLRNVIELADIGIIIHRGERLLYANPYVLERLRVASLDDVRGDEIMQYIHPEDRSALRMRIQDVMENHAVYHRVPLRYLNADGECFDVEASARSILYEGAPANLTISLDVTDSKRAATEKERIQRQVEHTQRLESLGVLAGGIAHDFNNILTAIMGNAAIAERKYMSNPALVKSYLGKIVQSSEKAALLCKQMLAYSGKGQFIIKPIDLSTMVNEVTALLEVSINQGVVIRYQLADALPLIEADESQLQQVIMNLVINASDAIADKNGVISISTGVIHADASYFSDGAVEVGADLPDGRYVFLEVTDSGCGMEDAVLAKLFEPFFTTKFTGRGLGMSAVLGIVRGHHGSIKVYSETGKGTTFTLLFPVAEAGVLTESTDNLSSDGDRYASGTVLIVDDEETIRETAAMMLEDMGFETLVAVDGLNGVAVYRQHQHEIVAVLLDMTMPTLDGKGCFRELRRINKDVKVILSSGYNEQEATGLFSGKRLAGFIQKPYHPDVLADVVFAAVRASSS